MSRPPPLGPTPNCVRNRLVLWVLKRAQHTWTLQLSDSFFAFRLVFLQVKAATRSTPCGLMRLLDDCFIFTEMISNQFEFGTLSRDLQSFIRPKWCIFSSIKCMIGCPLKGLGYLFRVQSQPQPHKKRWKRWQKFHNMGLRWLSPWGWQNCWTFWYFFGFGHGTETLAKLIGMFGGSFQLISG